MESLPARDVSALLGVVAELEHLDDPLPFPPRLLASLRRLIPCVEVGYGDTERDARRSHVQVWDSADGEQGVAVGDEWWEDGDQRDRWWSLRDTIPICAYRVSSGDWTQPYKVSDFATLRQFRRTPFHQAFLSGLVDYVLGVGVVTTPSRYESFAFMRVDRDFDERDRLVLQLLQPHLAARAKAAATAADAADALAAVEASCEAGASLVVLCTGAGAIQYASPAARRLLTRYLVVEDGRLPAELLARREVVARRDGFRLHVRIARTGGLRVLLLDERNLRLEQLTRREREILEAVARGLENEAIALELGIAPATVAKHLEHVFRKLGVPNRTAAAALLAGR